MIIDAKGNLLEADAEALVNTVNTVGVMGKGIALQFKQAFPENYEAFRKACARKEVVPGKMFAFETGQLTNPRLIINFPTKRHWRQPSRLADIEAGLVDLVRVLRDRGVKSVAVPPLGCGSGGLKWSTVRPLIVEALSALPDIRVLLFAPEGAPAADAMPVKTKRPTMNPNRASLLLAMASYALPGYRLTMLEIQKLAYLLQEIGQPLKLAFVKGPYGPYAEDLHKVLQRVEGHFIRGYGDRSRDASVRVLPEATAEAEAAVRPDPEASARLDKLREVIDGFESPYGMELLATAHWVAKHDTAAAHDPRTTVKDVQAWSPQKRRRFRPDHIELAWGRLHDQGLMQATR
jgi:O-acetyl-ADP-ribose deacetylase (regulator of RNase III)